MRHRSGRKIQWSLETLESRNLQTTLGVDVGLALSALVPNPTIITAGASLSLGPGASGDQGIAVYLVK